VRETYVAQRDADYGRREPTPPVSSPGDRVQPLGPNRSPPPNGAGNAQPPEMPDPLVAAQPIARVGSEVILVGDVLGPVNQQLAMRLRDGAIGQHEIEREREKLLRQALTTLIDQKLVILVARREIPPEALPKIEQSVNEQFDKTQLKSLLEQTKAKTKSELDELLKQSGSSLARQRKLYFEKSVTQEWIRREVNFEPEVTHDEMLAYYRERPEEFAIKAQARWEELMVRLDEFPTRADAWRALAEMGNRVLLRQATFPRKIAGRDGFGWWRTGLDHAR
jgi:hypothetical protein